MFHVITGGSGSGKSAYAEDCIVQLHKDSVPLYYIATMMPFGAEMEAKIDRHRKLRAGKGFETIECFQNLHFLTKAPEKQLKPNADVLLECMSNLVANEWFAYVQRNGGADCFSKERVEMVTDKIWRGVLHLIEHCRNLVVVTNEVFSECQEDTIEMDCYKQILAAMNYRMAAVADQVTEVVYGIPVAVK